MCVRHDFLRRNNWNDTSLALWSSNEARPELKTRQVGRGITGGKVTFIAAWGA